MKKKIEDQAIKISFDPSYDETISNEHKSFLDFLAYGKTYVTNKGEYIPVENVNVEDYDSVLQIEKLSAKEIIERFGGELTKEQIKKLEDGI